VNQPAGKKLAIIEAVDVKLAQQTARKLARIIRFDETASEEIAIVASELASNLIKHAHGGTLAFTPLATHGRLGLKIESKDDGPSIQDIEQAIADGYSTAGGLGRGLGAVNRLMDEMEISSLPGQGTSVVCCRWLRPKSTELPVRRLEFGVATCALRLAPANGDTFVLKQWEQNALAGVIDGLGHGELAQQAAQTARHYVERHYDQPLRSIFRGAGRACRSTRGVVMALARFELDRDQFSFASIGNVEARLLGGQAKANFIYRRGIVGVNAPEPVVTEHPWSTSSLFVMHSDGLSTRWAWNDFPHLAFESAPLISRRLLRALDKGEDDATVVVVKGVTA
jgi:anti-sigma regulatory factor (Ser/Thr protein kinase)